MKRWMGIGAAGALVGMAALAGGSMAQGPRGTDDDQFGSGRFERPGMRSLSPDDVAAFTDARIAALRAGLKLTPDQEKLWPPVESAIRGLAKQRQEARQARRERFMAMREQVERNIPDQLRFLADRQAASADALRKLADASAPLYAALDDGQKRRMAVLARGFMRQAGPGRHGGHWRRQGMMEEGGFGGPMRRGDAGPGSRSFAQGEGGKATLAR